MCKAWRSANASARIPICPCRRGWSTEDDVIPTIHVGLTSPFHELLSVLPDPTSHTTRASPGASEPRSSALPWDGDVALVRGFLAGRPEDRRAVLTRLECVPRIVNALNARMGGPLDSEDLRDLSQDVFMLVFRKLSEYDGRAPLDAWSLGIARFEFLNWVRRKRRGPERIDVTTLEARAEETEPVPIDPERVVLLLARLDRESAAVIHMHQFEGLTFRATAERLGLPLSTVKSRYFRGLQWLYDNYRSQLEAAGP